MWVFFKKKHPKDALSAEKLLPVKKPRKNKLGFGIGEAIVGALLGAMEAVLGTAFTVGFVSAVGFGALYTAVDILLYVALMAISTLITGLTSPKGSDQSIMRGSRTFNTRSPSEPLRLVVGTVKVGGNWVYVF